MIDLSLDVRSAEKMQRTVLGGAAVASGVHVEQGAWGLLVILLPGLVSSSPASSLCSSKPSLPPKP